MTSMRECESCTTNLNTPAPYAPGPSNTNESHDILEEKFRGVVSSGCTHFCWQGFSF